MSEDRDIKFYMPVDLSSECMYDKPHPQRRLEVLHLITDHINMGGNAVALNWVTLTFCMCIGHDHSFRGIETKVRVSVGNVIGGTSILNQGQF